MEYTMKEAAEISGNILKLFERSASSTNKISKSSFYLLSKFREELEKQKSENINNKEDNNVYKRT